MTPEEETNLATAVTVRTAFGMEAAVQTAGSIGLPADLTDLLRAGVAYEEIDLTLEGEGEDGYRYEWSLPQAGSTH